MDPADGDNGLIAGIGLTEAAGAQSLDWNAMADGRPEGFRLCWLHLDQKEERARSWIRKQAGIPDIAAAALVALAWQAAAHVARGVPRSRAMHA